MGNWTIFKRRDGEQIVLEDGMSLDRAFGLMMQAAGSDWQIVSKEPGGYRLHLTRIRPMPDLPYADPQMVSDFWPRVESEIEDRRGAEREIKIQMLLRGRDGIEAHCVPSDRDSAAANTTLKQVQPSEAP
jgi:hypothetical protein